MAVVNGDGISVTYTQEPDGITVTRIEVNTETTQNATLLAQPYVYVGTGLFFSYLNQRNISLSYANNGLLKSVRGTWTGSIKYQTGSTAAIQVGCNYEQNVAVGFLVDGVSVNITPSFPWTSITCQNNTAEGSGIKVDGETALQVTNTRGIANGTAGYSYQAEILVGDEVIGQVEDVGTSREIIVPVEVLELAQKSGQCNVSLCYNGFKLMTATSVWYMEPAPGLVDIKDVAFTVTPASDTVPEAWGGYVQGKSHAHTEADASIAYGELTFDVKIGEQEQQGKSLDFDNEQKPGQVECSLTVTDAWGRTETRQASFTVWPYSTPVIRSVKAYRCDAEGNEDEAGTNYKASAETVYSDCGGHNVPTLALLQKSSVDVEYKPVGDVPLVDGLVVPGGAPDVEKSYDVCFILTDTFNAVRYYAAVMTGDYFMYFRRGGKGVAVGKASEQDKLFDVGYDMRVRGDTVLDGELTINRPDGSNVTMTQILEALGL